MKLQREVSYPVAKRYLLRIRRKVYFLLNSFVILGKFSPYISFFSFIQKDTYQSEQGMFFQLVAHIKHAIIKFESKLYLCFQNEAKVSLKVILDAFLNSAETEYLNLIQQESYQKTFAEFLYLQIDVLDSFRGSPHYQPSNLLSMQSLAHEFAG